jgi:hypothetical protein
MAYGVVHQFAGGPDEYRAMSWMQVGIDGGFAAPPQETSFEVRSEASA